MSSANLMIHLKCEHEVLVKHFVCMNKNFHSVESITSDAMSEPAELRFSVKDYVVKKCDLARDCLKCSYK